MTSSAYPIDHGGIKLSEDESHSYSYAWPDHHCTVRQYMGNINVQTETADGQKERWTINATGLPMVCESKLVFIFATSRTLLGIVYFTLIFNISIVNI